MENFGNSENTLKNKVDGLTREALLRQKIEENKGTEKWVETKLETDQKVLARVTDGIYRQPGSAIRELISNAYDADAENIIIDTDVPRFETMTIRDDGNGMSIETLLNMLHHIGGSAKRSIKGADLGVTSTDSGLSFVKKRRLIGKIGIGLFSVAQLTREFEIVTKQRGSLFYLKARVNLHNYSEEYIKEVEDSVSDRGASFEAGSVYIWTEETENIDAHGTDIILKNIKKSARDQLRSAEIWAQESAQTDGDELDQHDILGSSNRLDLPKFHVGSSSGELGKEFFDESKNRTPSLPWDDDTPSHLKLSKLYDAVLDLTKSTVNPKLDVVLDNYLNMLWSLSLSVPLDYIEGHPFEHTLNDISNTFIISNKLKSQAVKLEKDTKKRFCELLKFKNDISSVDFNVVVDGVKLFRPIKYKNLPMSTAAVKKPIMFLGSYSPNFNGLGSQETGGELSFDAYILWCPKVIPKDHNGVLIRINNASGIMFDETFMKYQVAEHVIKGQLTIEIFVNRGLDSALNIDRESFNTSHPHYQIVMKWLHQALRQVINKYKGIRSAAVKKVRDGDSDTFTGEINKLTAISFSERGLDPYEMKPFVIESDKKEGNLETVSVDDTPIDAYRISQERYENITDSKMEKETISQYQAKVKSEAILRILDSYNLLNDLTPDKQDSLIEDLLKIISFKG